VLLVAKLRQESSRTIPDTTTDHFIQEPGAKYIPVLVFHPLLTTERAYP